MKDQIIMHVRDFDPKKAVFNLKVGSINKKPISALWSCDDEEELKNSAWIEWCRYNDYTIKDHLSIFKVIPKKDVKVLDIDEPNDVYKLPYTENPVVGKHFDYEKIAEEYDGVRFGWGAVLIGKLHNGEYPDWITGSMYWMDCASTVWFNNEWIENYTYIKEFEEV